MLYLELVKTSELSVPEKKELEIQEKISTIKDPHSTESSPILWLKEEISQSETEPVENPFTEINSKMKTSILNTKEPDSYPWPMLDLTPTDLNSSLLSLNAHG